MKISLLLSAAPLAAAFVFPNEQQVLSVFSSEHSEDAAAVSAESHHHEVEASDVTGIPDILGRPPWHHVSGWSAGIQEHTAYDEELRPKGKKCPHGKGEKDEKKNRERKSKDHHKEKHQPDHVYATEIDAFAIPPRPHHKPGFFDKIKGSLKHIFGGSPDDEHKPEDGDRRPPPPHGDRPHGPPPHHPHHHPRVFNRTIYELISASNHTRNFTHIINQYDDVVKYLNSTDANYTIFVPLDDAFKHIHHRPNVSKAAVLKWLEYHVSPKVFTRRDFFDVQTVPTFLDQENDSGNPQRISTLVGFKGLILNFHSHVVVPDIFATNGVIHGLGELLIPPLAAADTVGLVPSVFSTLDLALIKTGLIDIFDADVPKSGGTFFAPSNQAFAKLGPKINAFLFSPPGEKYLKALLKYHIVANHTLFSDAYYKPASSNETVDEDSLHLDLPTLLHGKPISIDIHHFHRFTDIVLNKHNHVSVKNIPTKEGVVHIVSSVLIPPHPHRNSSAHEEKENEKPSDDDHHHHHHHHRREMKVHELIERLDALIE